jgi:ferredoxin-NADP reductase
MATYKTKLTDCKEIAEHTIAFKFEKPAGFTFIPGQNAVFQLPGQTELDAEGNSRVFSITSLPEDNYLTIATRLRDTAFKKYLSTTNIGEEVTLKGPYGDFTLHADRTIPAVFLSGGIGITPMRSMILNAARKQLEHKIFLFYSNHRPEDSAFLADFEKSAQENPFFKFIPNMSDMDKSTLPWTGETGFIDENMLKRYLSDLTNSIYYISGPPGMVTAMRVMLTKAGVKDLNIRTEEFSGY